MSIPASGTTDAIASTGQALVLEARPRGTLRSLLSHRSAIAGMAVLAVYAAGTIFGPLALHGNPSNTFDYQNLQDAFLAPSGSHPLGTDQLGRDELVRLLYGTRYTLLIAVAAVGVGLAVGIPLGAVSGYFGPIRDRR